ncbi:ABC transporter ATP-binding protein [Elioraea tepida]|jgi:branched-chain amino acid transport system ATP-binding protein|uniref:ABC transporter ATP-binding protein n=1 Tax=Elioraea tepida TaxID=2843330 RepID=A0A975U4S2_9PROT|nr:ABC transporter ATP-binding protein [Elioraea tepida]QXM25026.1 ABC transporter ATP-binding protein [Elioraea tepida]
MSAIAAQEIGISFGGLRALDGVSFSAEPGEVFSIIGPNGAGKTTLFNIISGVYRTREGKVLLAGEDVTGLPPHRLAARGLSRTFQNLQVFFRMTAEENVMVGRHLRERQGVIGSLLHLPWVARQNRATRERARELLAFVGLADRARDPAGSLPYGALKRLEIARALAAEPRVLLLDEPAAGCNPVETEEIDRLIAAIAARGTTVVLVEHDMKLVMRISNRILVLNHGRMLALGSPAEVRGNPEVIAAYLGRHGAEAAHASG